MTLLEIKEFITEKIGNKIVIKQRVSHRTTLVRYEGIVREVYDNLFIVEQTNTRINNKRLTFNYRDILTKAIELEDN